MNAAAKILSALNALSVRCRDDDLSRIKVFLDVCIHNGICIGDIAELSGLSVTKVSRAVEALRMAGEQGLVEVHHHPSDGRRRLVFLTEDGMQLRDQIELIFVDAPPPG
jgi:DNA-binding MarR family transcriptional regulator